MLRQRINVYNKSQTKRTIKKVYEFQNKQSFACCERGLQGIEKNMNFDKINTYKEKQTENC